MKKIYLDGTPFNLGYRHGMEGKQEIHFNLEVYEKLFYQQANLSWRLAREMANHYVNCIESYNSSYLDEIFGIAAGAGVDIEDILVLNCRSEIALTNNRVDGCTSLALLKPFSISTFLGQNWDWRPSQEKGLVFLKIFQKNKPIINCITEAGIIGKIGFNSARIGVCLNAIRANLRSSGIPIHIGLRAVLESNSMNEAIKKVTNKQLASAANFLIAQGYKEGFGEAVNLELSPKGEDYSRSGNEPLFHTNHFCSQLLLHQLDGVFLPDSENSYKRLSRLKELLSTSKTSMQPVDEKQIISWFSDHDNYPESICFHETSNGKLQIKTIFSVLMNLTKRQMLVIEGNPCTPKKTELYEL